MTSTLTTVTATEIVLPGLVEPDGLQVRLRMIGEPAPGQLLVAVEATGVSSAEKAMRRGRYFGQPAFPFVPGYDLVGTVLAVGIGGDAAIVGERVAVLTKTGGWASHALVSARDAIIVPRDVSAAAIETLIVNGVTAWQMLHRTAKVKAGQTILVHGANSGVGGILSQLAEHAGVRVIGTASPRHHDRLRAAGVEPVDYNDPAFEQTVRALVPGGADAVFDNVGGEMMHASYRLTARGGTLVCYSIMSATAGTGNLIWPFVSALSWTTLWSLLPTGRRASFYNVWTGHSARPARFRARLVHDLGSLVDLVQRGVLTPEIAASFPLTEAAAALTLAESRTTAGKIVLLP